ncbi:MAG: NCS2 family permease [Opitutales bacterium]
MLAARFLLRQHGTTVPRELQAGLTTFAAMAYILAVNPSILAASGMPAPALVTVTGLTAAFATALMAFLTNYPIALAPGMGINAYFAFTICGLNGVPWPDALGMVFINGLLFLLLSVTGVREKIIEAIPLSLKLAIAGGIGLFIAFIGLKNGGVIVADPDTFVRAGDLSHGAPALCLAGIVLTAWLVARKTPGAIVLGMLAITLAGLFVSAGAGQTVTVLPSSLVSRPASPAPIFLHLRFHFLENWPAFLNALPIILTLLIVDLFDNLGTLIALAKRIGLLDSEGRLPRAGRALIADSLATILSALFGTSTVVCYIESAAGIEAGGRTGLTSLTTAALMLLALFFTPLILSIPAAATAPALVVVGILMMQPVAEIQLGDFATAAPAVLTLLAIPLTFSISDGLGLGLICAALLALALGKPRSFPAAGYVVAAIFFLDFFKIWPFWK